MGREPQAWLTSPIDARLPPAAVLPAALGLRWGMAPAQCVRTLGRAPLGHSVDPMLVSMSHGPAAYLLRLTFSAASKLRRIETTLYRSHAFWDADRDYAEMETRWTAAARRYRQSIRWYSRLLGPPSFSQEWDWDVADYPEGETEGHLTHWRVPDGRLQLLLAHADKELPITLDLACYPERNAHHTEMAPHSHRFANTP